MNELDRADPVPRLQGPVTPPARGVDGISWLYGVALLILAFAVARLWIMPPAGPPAPAANADAVAQQIREVETRLARLESRGAPDVEALAARVGALEQRVASLDHPPPISAPPVAVVAGGDLATMTSDPGLAAQLGAERQRVTLLARLETAQLALAQGRPLGDWPDAPAALARYAKSPPPTEATLRLTFDAAAQAALAGGRPPRASDASVWQRALGRMEALVTVREGEQVLLGDPAAGTVAHARHALEAGDLAGAVDTLKKLPPPAAEAFSGWTAQAQALLDARSALATLAAGV